MTTSAAHRYFLDGSYNGGVVRPLPYPEWDSSVTPDLRYAYDVLQAALPEIHASGLHFHFTKDAYRLPEYGPHVVAVLLQEERCKVPVYGRHVRATIRNLTSRPLLNFRLHRRMAHLEALLLFEYARDWYTHLKALRAQRQPPPEMGRQVRPDPYLITLPLGYHSQEERPQVPMAERPLDCFFAGQIKHAIRRSDYRHWTSTSKFVAREQLWHELQRLDATGKWNIDLGKIQSADATASAGYADYSDKMSHSRICVAPRGSVAETYRAFEGLRAGCLVVANRLGREPLLEKSPIIQIDHWRELEGLLDKYARNIHFLERARVEARAWWDTHFSPSVRGRRLAQELNTASATMSAP